MQKKISHQAIIDNICRLGLGMLKAKTKTKCNGIWVAIVDFTMNQGVSRILPVLKLSEATMNSGSAPTMKNTECLSVIPMISTIGPEIANEYKKLFDQIGYPSAFLQDGGGNLSSAVKIINEQRIKENQKPIPVIPDVGHYSAAINKKEFNSETYIKELQKRTTEFNNKVRLTPFSFLSGPKSRTAGCYMGHMKKLIVWLFKLRKLSQGKGRPIKDSVREKINSIFPDLKQLIQKLEKLIMIFKVEEYLLKILKNNGLNLKSYVAVKRKLNTLPVGHFYKEAMLDWLNHSWEVRKTLGIKGSLTVSSDIIETANGQWKHITKRMASKEATHLTLAFPTLFGTLDQQLINEFIDSTPIAEVDDWCREKIPMSRRKIQNEHLSPNLVLTSARQLFADEFDVLCSQTAF